MENIDAEKDKDKIEASEKRNQEWTNLTPSEKRGIRKLVEIIRNNEIMILKTDTSERGLSEDGTLEETPLEGY